MEEVGDPVFDSHSLRRVSRSKGQVKKNKYIYSLHTHTVHLLSITLLKQMFVIIPGELPFFIFVFSVTLGTTGTFIHLSHPVNPVHT